MGLSHRNILGSLQDSMFRGCEEDGKRERVRDKKRKVNAVIVKWALSHSGQINRQYFIMKYCCDLVCALSIHDKRRYCTCVYLCVNSWSEAFDLCVCACFFFCLFFLLVPNPPLQSDSPLSGI